MNVLTEALPDSRVRPLTARPHILELAQELPQSGSTVTNFYETHRTVNQGSSTWLVKTDTCYNDNSASPLCTNTAIALPLTLIKNFVTLSNNQQTLTRTNLNSFGLPIQVDEYDLGNGTPGVIVRSTQTAYASLGNGIISLPASIIVQDGGGTQFAKTTFGYDETAPTTTSGVPQHVSVTGSRGNLTSLNRWLNTTNLNLTSTFTFDDTGNVLTGKDPNGNTTTFSYTDAWANTACPATGSLAYVTQVTNPLNQNAKSTYYPCTGAIQAVADQNDINASRAGTTYTYDLLNRRLTTNFPDGGEISDAYSDAAPNFNVTRSQMQTSGGGLVTLGTSALDSLGRPSQTTINDPEGNVFASASYDSVGRVASVSDPYRSTNNPAHGSTQPQYDALGRITKVTKSDGSFATADYSQLPAVTVTDEAGKVRKTQVDGLGRLIKVWEDPNGLNYETDYQYDVLGNLIRVDQKGSAPSDSTQWRTRTYAYDSLSRVLCAAQPEIGGSATCPKPDNGSYTPGTTRYSYDSNGNVLTRQAPAPNQASASVTVTTNYSYDALNRLTQKTYSDGTTKSAFFSFDVVPAWGVPVSNIIGRLAWAHSDLTGPRGASIFSYDSVGRVIMNNQCTPANCGSSSFATNYTYDLAGNMTSYTTGVGVTFTQTLDTLGRLTQLTSSFSDSQHPATLATVDSTAGYYATGAVRKITYGNTLTESPAFNIRLQPCRTNLNSTGAALLNCGDAAPAGTVQDFKYGFSPGASDNGNLVSLAGSGTQTLNRTYGYDSLNRLASMSAPGDVCTGLSWTIDAWGSRIAQTNTGGSCSIFSAASNSQNRLTGNSYDAAGNVTNDGTHAYIYDAENRLIQVDGGNTATYVYDALGRRVHKATGSSWKDNIYDLAGNVVTEYTNSCASLCWTTSYIYANGQRIAQYSNGTTYFIHKDHLGSTHLMTAAGAATHIQSSGGATVTKWYDPTGLTETNGAVYTYSVRVQNLGAFPITVSDNTMTSSQTVPAGATVAVSFTRTGDGIHGIQFLFNTDGHDLNIVAYYPSITTGSGGNLIGAGDLNFAGSGWRGYQGSTAAITQGQPPFVIDSMDFMPYGEQIAGGTTTTHKFTGDERDSESNLDHTWFRQYSSAQGRWTTPDPYWGSMDFANPQSLNRYSYTLNNPMNAIDPSGLECVTFDNGVIGDDGQGDECDHMTQGNGPDATVDGGQPPQVPTEDPRPPNNGGDNGGGSILPRELQPVPGTRPNRAIDWICRNIIPSGRTSGVSVATGGVGGPVAGGEVVYNYSSKQWSAFGYAGASAGWNGVVSASGYTGFVWGLDADNSNYKGGFTGLTGGALVGGFAASSSGGLTGGGKGLRPDGQIKTLGISVGSSLTLATGGVNATNYTNPLQLGRTPPVAGPIDLGLVSLRQAVCQ